MYKASKNLQHPPSYPQITIEFFFIIWRKNNFLGERRWLY